MGSLILETSIKVFFNFRLIKMVKNLTHWNGFLVQARRSKITLIKKDYKNSIVLSENIIGITSSKFLHVFIEDMLVVFDTSFNKKEYPADFKIKIESILVFNNHFYILNNYTISVLAIIKGKLEKIEEIDAGTSVSLAISNKRVIHSPELMVSRNDSEPIIYKKKEKQDKKIVKFNINKISKYEIKLDMLDLMYHNGKLYIETEDKIYVIQLSSISVTLDSDLTVKI